MRKAAVGLAFVLVGCGVSKEEAYRQQLECFAVQDMTVKGFEADCCASAKRRQDAATNLEAYRRRVNQRARDLGKGPADVAADARAFLDKIDYSNAHGTEEYLDQVLVRCATAGEA